MNTNNIAHLLNWYECKEHNDTQELSAPPKYITGKVVIDEYEINTKGIHIKVTHWYKDAGGTTLYKCYWLSYQGSNTNPTIYPDEFYLPRELND